MPTSFNDPPSADPRESRLAAHHPRVYLALHVLTGVAVTALLVWGFAALADAVFEKGRVLNLDVGLTAWIQAHDTEYGEKIFSLVSWLGAPVLIGIIVVASGVFAWRRDWIRALTLVLTTSSGAALNAVLKHLFHRGRPEYANEFITHATWSFPSGHAMDSMVGYGILLVLLLEHTRATGRRRLLLLGGIVVIVAIGASRVYLGVHYLTDVIGGWFAGGAWLFVCVTAYRFANWRLHPMAHATETHASANTQRRA